MDGLNDANMVIVVERYGHQSMTVVDTHTEVALLSARGFTFPRSYLRLDINGSLHPLPEARESMDGVGR